ncbi:hypothetical protein BH10ACI4_BH10ACI4_32860 [soil metagenome]
MSCISRLRFPFRTSLIVPLALSVCCSAAAIGQGPAATKPASEVKLIPVTDPLVKEKCGTCHTPDAKGNLSRISAVRTTPEGWEEAIKRMVRLNGLQLSPDEARKILRYLSDAHGLAPEEATPVEYFAEHRLIDEKLPSPEIQRACASCHAFAKPMSWRRTPDDWELLKNMHLAFFPSIDGSFRRGGPGSTPSQNRSDESAAPPKQPVDLALEYIKKTNVLMTPAWSNWSSSVQSPKLAGTWVIKGAMPGRGKFFGTVAITDKPGTNDYATETKITFVDGTTWSGSGTSLVYTGFQWRGRIAQASKIDGIDAPNGVRQVMLLSNDQSELTGRWFWGTYQEFGLDVTMRRADNAATLLGIDIGSLKAGSTDNQVRLYGHNLPAGITADQIAMGPGVKVTSVVSSTPDMVTILASVDAGAAPGKRPVTVANNTVPSAFAVYNHVDFLKVTPVTAIAHLGSEPHAKGFMQFEAVGFTNGADGKANTEDDIDLGPVKASWKIEEFVASYGDDDIQYVGSMDEKTGLFTPASDGPNPKRKSMRNNYGDVWSVASYTPPGESKPIIGRAYFVVSIPQYQQWDQPEVGQ